MEKSATDLCYQTHKYLQFSSRLIQGEEVVDNMAKLDFLNFYITLVVVFLFVFCTLCVCGVVYFYILLLERGFNTGQS